MNGWAVVDPSLRHLENKQNGHRRKEVPFQSANFVDPDGRFSIGSIISDAIELSISISQVNVLAAISKINVGGTFQGFEAFLGITGGIAGTLSVGLTLNPDYAGRLVNAIQKPNESVCSRKF